MGWTSFWKSIPTLILIINKHLVLKKIQYLRNYNSLLKINLSNDNPRLLGQKKVASS